MKLVTLLFSLALLFVTFSVSAAEPSQRIAELQAGLAELGYDPGPVDGLLGQKTREAIMAFQKDERLIYSDLLSRQVDYERDRAPQRRALLAMSDEELIKLIEGASEEEFGWIPELIPERFADLPFRSALGKRLPPGSEAVFSIPLRLLLYPPSREGVEQFQADIGAEVTGELTFRQIQEGHRRWLRQRDTPVHLGEFTIWISDDSASASGTWLVEDEETVTPINAVEITCDRERRECLSVTAELLVPSLDDDNFLLDDNNSLTYLSRDDDNYYLRLMPIRRYLIISWSGGEIVAQERRGCDVAVLTLNRNSNMVQEVVTNDEDVHPNCRNPPPPFERPRIARLTSGWAADREFWRKRQEVTSSYLNPRVWEQIKQASGPAEPFELPRPAIGPSDRTQPTTRELLERRRRELQGLVDKRNE